MSETELVSKEILEAMGISQQAFEEILSIVGRMPTIDEVSTLLAMWQANGQQQSLYGWLRGQHHIVEKHEYLYDGELLSPQNIVEPRVKDCLSIVKSVFVSQDDNVPQISMSSELYLVGDISTEFLHSEYAEKYLHMASSPIVMDSNVEVENYLSIVLSALKEAGLIKTMLKVNKGGVFSSLANSCRDGKVGFDILTCREVRLDAFLFGEGGCRFLVSLDEGQVDFFLLKMDEACINCCFLGRTTKGRVLIDGMDFGSIEDYLYSK